MRIKYRVLSLLVVFLLLAQPYIVLAEVLTETADTASAALEQAGDDDEGEDGGIIQEDGNPPEDNSAADSIDSEEEFQNWAESNPYGGSITLGRNITLTMSYLLYGAVSIDTGAYGITFDGGYIAGFPLSITGEGVDNPVLTILYTGRFNSWESILPSYNVTARGRHGEGGVAVYVVADGGGSSGIIETQGHIRSEGVGAVGVLFDNPVRADFLSISVEGENSAAVIAPDGTNFYYSKLEASGDGSKVVSGGNILLDTCGVSGDTGYADVVNRKILALAGNWLYWPLTQGLDDISDNALYKTFHRVSALSFLVSGENAHPAEVRRIYAQWDNNAIDTVDTSVIGKTVIRGTLYDTYQGLGLEDDFSLDLTIDVQESGKPCIVAMSFGSGSDGSRYVFFQTKDAAHGGDWFVPQDGNFILWRSDDEDESWYDFTDDVSLASFGITYYYDSEITNPTWFCIQEVGGEYSNIAIMFGYEGDTYGSLGGDRTGVDRGGELTVPAPKPTPKPESESTPKLTPESESAPEFQPTFASTRRSIPLPEVEQTSPPELEPTPELQPIPTSAPEVESTSAESTTAPELESTSKTELPQGTNPMSPADIPKPTDRSQAFTDVSDSISTIPDEWKDDTTTAISGRRLRMMMSAGSRVTFVQNSLRLSFDSAALETLAIGDNQLFTVTVECLAEPMSYAVSAAIDETELFELPCVVILDENKYDILVSGIYDFAQQLEVLDGSQAYPSATLPSQEQVEEVNVLDETEKKPLDWIPITFVLIGVGGVIAAGGFVGLRVRKC